MLDVNHVGTENTLEITSCVVTNAAEFFLPLWLDTDPTRDRYRHVCSISFCLYVAFPMCEHCDLIMLLV